MAQGARSFVDVWFIVYDKDPNDNVQPPPPLGPADLYRSGKYATTGHKERVVCLVTLAMLLLAKGSRLAHTDTNATQAVQLHAQCSELLNRADQFTKNFYLTKCGTGTCGIVFLPPPPYTLVFCHKLHRV